MMMMKQQDMFGCNNNNNHIITEINQIVLNPLNPSTSSMDQQQHEDQVFINSYDLHFPHPFLDDDDDLFLSHFLSQQQQEQQLFDQEEEEIQDETTRKMKTKKKKKLCGSSRKKGSSCTKRRGKKDRHSKIYTAQGPRDRRMRLSLQIARKFFDLQDMLGFDKASKTIEWLLLNSNSAIKDLKQTYLNNNSGVNHSSCVYSGQSREIVSEINNDQEQEQEEGGGFMGSLKDKKSRTLRIVAREARDRARARARQRTLLKNTPFFSHPPINFDDHLSGNDINNINTYLDYPTFSCPNSIFLPSPSPLPLPYSFSDSTLLKLCPNFQ